LPCCPVALLPAAQQQGLASPYAKARVGRRSQPTQLQGLAYATAREKL